VSYKPGGVPGNEVRVNSYEHNWQRDSVLALKGGGFLVTWSSYFDEYDDSNIETTYVAAQFYDAKGHRSGDELAAELGTHHRRRRPSNPGMHSLRRSGLMLIRH
jgi:hypothetical protein